MLDIVKKVVSNPVAQQVGMTALKTAVVCGVIGVSYLVVVKVMLSETEKMMKSMDKAIEKEA
jgi:hypothetical protein